MKVVHLKKDKYDAYVGRPTKFGNPFSHKSGTLAKFKTRNRTESLIKYKEWVLSQPELIKEIKRELKNKVLSCWCWPKQCHAEILLAIANDWPLPIYHLEDSTSIFDP